jgi:hypothetical protein
MEAREVCISDKHMRAFSEIAAQISAVEESVGRVDAVVPVVATVKS